MKIKKKTLYIVLPLSILVVLLLLLFVFLMGWFGNTPKLNRYDSLMELCEVEKKFFKVLVKCDVFVNETSQKDGKNCLDLTVVNKENTNIVPLEVCEKEKILDTSNPVLDTDMKVPMHMVFEYTYLPPLSYGISRISMELMGDSEISSVLSKLNNEEINTINIRFQERVNAIEKGYYYYESDEIIDGMRIGMITFINVSIRNMTIEDNSILIDFALSVNGVSRDLTVKESEIQYFSKSKIEEVIMINPSMLSVIDKVKSYDISFYYIPREIEIDYNKILEFCSEKVEKKDPLCEINENLSKFLLNVSIEDYVENSFEKLIFRVLVSND